MSIFRITAAVAVFGFAMAGCAYGPQAAAPSWTDAQLADAPPSAAPAYIPEETLEPSTFAEVYAQKVALVERRDAVQAAAAQIPGAQGRSEAFAADARERAEPPEPPEPQ